MKTIVYWVTKNKSTITRIRNKFNIPFYTSINGETTCEIKEEDLELLREVEKKGFIQIRNK